MNRPEGIPADVWDEYRSILSCNFKLPIPGPEMLILACRAALAYGQSRADEATERAAKAIEDHEIWHGSEGDGLRQRSEGNRSGLAYATAIRSQK